MKYMIIADVHGNFSELKKHIDIFKNDKYDCLIINGDLCADYSTNSIIAIVVASPLRS